MNTRQRLRLGFGALSALLALFVGVILVQLSVVRREVNEMALVSRPRAVVVRELQVNVLDYAVHLEDFLERGEAAELTAAMSVAEAVDSLTAAYELLAATDQQRDLWADFSARWTPFAEFGRSRTSADDSAAANDLSSLRDEALALLEAEVLPEATAAFESDRDAALRYVNITLATGLILLVVGLAASFLTSRYTTEGVLAQEAKTVDALNQLDSMFQSMREGVALFDRDGNIVGLNQALATMHGYPSVESMKQNLAQFHEVFELFEGDGRTLPAADWPAARVLRGETIADLELRVRRRDMPLERFLTYSGMPVRDARGEEARWLLIVHDVTGKHQAEAQLRQAQKMEAVGQLTGGIAHDFNNILTVIIGNAEVMVGQCGDHSELRAALEELLQAARRGATMIERLLLFSRRGMLTKKPVHLGGLVRGLGEMLRRLLPETIRVEVSDATGVSDTVLADPGSVEQILMNLCTNARDAMPGGGKIRVECARTRLDEGYYATHPWVAPGPYISISVSDTGTGMDEATQRRVFEPFFTTKSAGTGTGLGLAMVYGLMKEHRGMVHVYSEVGMGTTIKLYFPAHDRSEATGSAPERPSDTRAVGGGDETILLAEDEAAVRRMTVRALTSKGYTVLAAEDGEEALDLYRKNKDRIRLVISDLVMPKLGGRQFAEALRTEGSEVRILFTSGYAPDAASRAGDFPDGVEFLQKPWTLADLFARVRDLLDS